MNLFAEHMRSNKKIQSIVLTEYMGILKSRVGYVEHGILQKRN